MCLLMPFLPSCLLKIYLELKQAGHGGRTRLFTQRGGNRTQALALLLLPSAQPPSCIFPEHPKTPVISRFYATDSHQSRERSYFSANLCVCWCGCMYSMSCADEMTVPLTSVLLNMCSIYIKIAHAGLNPRLGNELQLQQMKSNYINCLPVDGPSSFFSCIGTRLQPYIIAFDLCNRQRHTAGPHLSG